MFWDTDADEEDNRDKYKPIATGFLPALKHSERFFPSVCFFGGIIVTIIVIIMIIMFCCTK